MGLLEQGVVPVLLVLYGSRVTMRELVPEVVDAHQHAENVRLQVQDIDDPALLEVGNLIATHATVIEPKTAVGMLRERGRGDQQRIARAESARDVRLGRSTIAAAIGYGVPLKHDDRSIGRRRRPAGGRPGGPERRTDRRGRRRYEIASGELWRHVLLG